MARLLVLDVKGMKGFYEVECEELGDFYTHLQCNTFDIVSRKIGGKWFDVFCDDEGLFVEHPIPSAIYCNDMSVALVGNLIFAKHDAEGNTTGLNEDEIEEIKNASVAIINVDAEEPNATYAVFMSV